MGADFPVPKSSAFGDPRPQLTSINGRCSAEYWWMARRIISYRHRFADDEDAALWRATRSTMANQLVHGPAGRRATNVSN